MEKENWTSYDGLGALIISPTRELALQIFQELRKVGKYHSFSAGLLIGGKNLKQEQERVGRMNILVTTPGRLLQHLDQSSELDSFNLKVLVFDEADRILDAGFEKTVNAIIDHLPKSRQTLLFSATQTKSVKDLARLSLKDPEYIAVHEKAESSTPQLLVQKYIVTPLPNKLDLLFSFIKTHLKQKIIVFLSSCKQVRFVFETFCKMQPGIPLLCLHGKQKQQKRMGIFSQFCKKSEACLFATDIAARGLDFPAVDWVIQVDCPEDAATYIHRVGRTARYNATGQALMMLLPTEKEGMLSELEKKKVPIAEIKANPSKTLSVKGQLASLCSQSPEIKYLAQKSFVCYVRSIFLQSNKSIFDVHALPLDEYAESLGLSGSPSIKFLEKDKRKNESRQLQMIDNTAIKRLETSKSDSEEEQAPSSKQKTRVDRMFEKKNNTILSDHYAKMIQASDESSDDADNFLSMKRQDHDLDDTIPEINTAQRKTLTKKEKAKKESKGKKMVFDEEGNAVEAFKFETLEEFEKKGISQQQSKFVVEQSEKMKKEDEVDKSVAKAKQKAAKQQRKLKERARRKQVYIN